MKSHDKSQGKINRKIRRPDKKHHKRQRKSSLYDHPIDGMIADRMSAHRNTSLMKEPHLLPINIRIGGGIPVIAGVDARGDADRTDRGHLLHR